MHIRPKEGTTRLPENTDEWFITSPDNKFFIVESKLHVVVSKAGSTKPRRYGTRDLALRALRGVRNSLRFRRGQASSYRTELGRARVEVCVTREAASTFPIPADVTLPVVVIYTMTKSGVDVLHHTPIDQWSRELQSLQENTGLVKRVWTRVVLTVDGVDHPMDFPPAIYEQLKTLVEKGTLTEEFIENDLGQRYGNFACSIWAMRRQFKKVCDLSLIHTERSRGYTWVRIPNVSISFPYEARP